MALLNNTYIFVQDEEVKRGITASEHPVENGINITDHVKRNAVTISLRGEIVGKNAAAVLSKITGLHQSGGLVNYSGRNILKNAIITSFDTGHPNTIHGGCSFTMELKEIRIATTSYKENPQTAEKTTAGTQQVEQGDNKAVYHTVKKGDTIWGLVNKTYKSVVSTTVQAVINANPGAFSRPGDATTLQIGRQLYMGERK